VLKDLTRKQIFSKITADVREALRERWGPTAEIRRDLQKVREISERRNEFTGPYIDSLAERHRRVDDASAGVAHIPGDDRSKSPMRSR